MGERWLGGKFPLVFLAHLGILPEVIRDPRRLTMAAAKPRPVAAKKKAPRTSETRTVDAKSRLLLPKEFANATVTVERVGENEIRIRKAVVVPVDEFPLIEGHLKPLSDRDRDLFLQLLENPPEPTPALRKALQLHKKRHG
jgi:uncharacterized protein DUF1778